MRERVTDLADSLSTRTGDGLDALFRRGILTASGNRLIASGVRRFGMRLGAARFVAGESFDEAIPVLRALNDAGLRTNTSLLGEHVDTAAMAREVASTYRTILGRIAAEGLTTNVALKLTHLGLDLGEDVARENLHSIVAHAAKTDAFIRIDMEESSRVDATLSIYRQVREAGFDNVGTVLQSYLYRTPQDLDTLLPLSPNLRLVKGAYLEPAGIAYPRKADVDAAYVTLAERMLRENSFTAIATHDEGIIEHVIAFTSQHGIDRNRFEFQMLYGIRPQLQRDLVARGYRVLVATPFGPDWYPYLMRRLAERPANVMFFVRGVIKR